MPDGINNFNQFRDFSHKHYSIHANPVRQSIKLPPARDIKKPGPEDPALARPHKGLSAISPQRSAFLFNNFAKQAQATVLFNSNNIFFHLWLNAEG
ncbi:MAG: hypothetical protein GY850_02680 [bacterium]|nr:hypothetical protein [bacterium]